MVLLLLSICASVVAYRESIARLLCGLNFYDSSKYFMCFGVAVKLAVSTYGNSMLWYVECGVFRIVIAKRIISPFVSTLKFSAEIPQQCGCVGCVYSFGYLQLALFLRLARYEEWRTFHCLLISCHNSN